MVLRGVNSVMVPLPSVVVVVSDTWAHAKGAANANAMLNITFFIFPFLFSQFAYAQPSESPAPPIDHPFYGLDDPRLPDRRLGLKDAGFNSLRRGRAPGYSTECGNCDLRHHRSGQDFLRPISTPFGWGSSARYCRSKARRAFSIVLPIPTIPFSKLCSSKTTNVPRRRLSCGRRTPPGLRG